MTKTFTENDLLRFIYGELTPQEKKELELSLITDEGLRDQLRQLQEINAGLDRVQFKAPEKAVQQILKYSASYRAQELCD